MDRLQQIASEIIRLYRQQLNLWTLGKITTLKDADLLQYDRRRDRIELLRRELEAMVRTGKAGQRESIPPPRTNLRLLEKILATPGDAERQQLPAATARKSHRENTGLSDAAVEIFVSSGRKLHMCRQECSLAWTISILTQPWPWLPLLSFSILFVIR